MQTALSPEMLATIELVLAEDIGAGDATTNSIIPADAILTGQIVAKSVGVVAGASVAGAVFKKLDSRVAFNSLVADGDETTAGKALAEIAGPARAILSAERTALNFLGRMCGVATLTRQFVNEVQGSHAKILDTRKTVPGLRFFDKFAVRIGGGENHRMGLFDMILIKDNHIDFAGSITKAVERARDARRDLQIEVEARTLNDVRQCLDLDVGWIMLDNMQREEMCEAVRLSNGRAKLEASGNVTLENVRSIAETGVDYISIGALTHSVRSLDLSLTVNRDI